VVLSKNAKWQNDQVTITQLSHMHAKDYYEPVSS